MLVKQTIWATEDERCIHYSWNFDIRCDNMLGNRESGIWFDGLKYYRGNIPTNWDATKEIREINVKNFESIG
jgi:hypothetical protein